MTGWHGWAAITDFADQAVVLPLALLVLAALRSRDRGDAGSGTGASDDARGWAVAVGVVLLTLLLLKRAVGACAAPAADGRHTGLLGLGLRSPSGHTAAGGIVYGGLLALALRRGTAVSAACCLAAAALFGASRLVLGVHTPVEVAVSCVVAAAGGAVLSRLGRWPGRSLPAGPLRAGWLGWVAAALALVLVLHGRRLEVEPMIARVASIWLSPACNW